jgi:hypothetical protein
LLPLGLGLPIALGDVGPDRGPNLLAPLVSQLDADVLVLDGVLDGLYPVMRL